MKATLLFSCCVLLFGCQRHRDAQAEHMLVCGTLMADDAKPVPNALVHLHRIEKDIPGDLKANSFEVAVTEDNGSFHLGSAAPDHQYWFAIAGVHSRSAVYAAPEYESARIPVTFRRIEGTGDCKANIHVVVKNCTLKFE